MNKKSGWKALTGTTDFGKISSSSDPQCKLAFDIFVDRIIGYIGSYYVKLDGQVDALVFAGGIGEKATLLRTRIVEKCSCLGFELDKESNEKKIEDVVQDIGKGGARHRTLICQTDEQVRRTSDTHVQLVDTDILIVRDGSAVCCKYKNLRMLSKRLRVNIEWSMKLLVKSIIRLA